jgi:hypothetical protein
MMKPKLTYANVTATLALVLAVGTGGAYADQILVGSKQIRNGSILSQDIHKDGVKSSDIDNGTVHPADVTMPPPDQLQESDTASAQVGTDFQLVDVVGTYDKQDPTSTLEVDWTGTAVGTPCWFQIRVDGQPSGTTGGDVYANGGIPISVSATALFEGLPTGSHQIEVWARAPSTRSCVVGPAAAELGQTFVVSEQVV